MSIPGSASPLFFTAAADAAAFTLEKSVRFNKADTAYLNKTFSSAGTTGTTTFSAWVKRAALGVQQSLISVTESGNYAAIQFSDDDQLVFNPYSSSYGIATSDAKFRDPSAWYHVVVTVDVSNSTSADRLRLYVNGARLSTVSYTAPTAGILTKALEHRIGLSNSTSHPLGAYLADVYLIDGQALEPTEFGAYDDNGVWQAKDASGLTFGTNGFHLFDFANETGIGNDSSGNDNDFTVNNISQASLTTWSNGWSNNLLSGFPATNSFNGTGTGLTIGGSNVKSTWTAPSSLAFTTLSIRGSHDGANIKVNGTDVTSQFSSGLSIVTVTGVSSPLTSIDLDNTNGQGNARISAIRIDGELLADATPYPGAGNDVLRDVPTNGDTSDDTGAGGELSSNYCVLNPLDQKTATLTNGNLEAQIDSDGSRFVRGTIAVSSGKYYWEFKTLSSNNMALGVVETTGTGNLSDSGSYYYYANGGALYGNSSGKASSWGGSTLAVGDVLGVALDMDNGTLQYYKNGSLIGTAWTGLTGKTLAPAIGTGGGSNNKTACNFGQRAFAYGNAGTNRPAATFKALCTTSLPTPTIADGSDYFDAKTYSGTGSNISVPLGFEPDFVWTKCRSASSGHVLQNRLSGITTKYLQSQDTDQEYDGTGGVQSTSSTGFVQGTGSGVNQNGKTYVSWAWDAGSSNTSISTGGLNSSAYDTSQTWSSTGTTTNSSTVTDAFDGNLSSYWGANANTISKYTFASVYSGSKFELYIDVSLANTNFSVNGQSSSSVSGVISTPQWVDVTDAVTASNLGGLSYIEIGYVPSVHSQSIYGIRIDDKMLIDSNVTLTNIPTTASTVRANQAAGFSLISYTGSGTAGKTIGHGLNAAPEVIIVKNRDSAVNWVVGHQGLDSSSPWTKNLYLNTTDASSTLQAIWNNTAPTNLVFTVGASSTTNSNGNAYIAYCFAPVANYSQFGVYEGNGSTDGQFVYTGFRPRWILVKASSKSDNWRLWDSARSTANPASTLLFPDSTIAEITNAAYNLDFLSNGFKLRTSNSDFNGSGHTMIYMAFAENPFQANGGLAR